MRLRRPSTSTVIASLALFFALGGTAIAARHYLITTTSQIKPSVLAKLKGNAGRAGAQGPAGAPGLQGPQGPQGPAGPAVLSALTLQEGPENRVPADNELGPSGFEGIEGSAATCPAGDHVVSGGSNVYAGIVSGMLSVPSEDHRSWIVVVANGSTFANGEVEALAYCAGAGNAIAAARNPRGPHALALKETARLMAKLAVRVRASKG
jgi:hypothetical protein